MYDCQLFYWPLMNAMVELTLYLDGSFLLKSEDLEAEELEELAVSSREQAMEVDDYLELTGLVFLDHLPILELKN